MNKYHEIFLSRIVSPLIVAILLPSVLAIYSLIETGNLLQRIKEIPIWITLLFTGTIVMWLLVNIYLERRSQISKLNSDSDPPIIYISNSGYGEIGKMALYNLQWIIEHPIIEVEENVTELNMWKFVDPKRIDVCSRARCPICGTEVEEIHTFWGKIRHVCPTGDFKTTSRYTLSDLCSKVEKIARREVEKKKYNS